MAIIRRIKQFFRDAAGKFMRRPRPTITRYRWYYRCTFTDPETKRWVAVHDVEVYLDNATNYQRASAEARRATIAYYSTECPWRVASLEQMEFHCRRVGEPIGVP